MRLTERIYLVGGGNLGFGLSHDSDCHVYAIDGGDEIALVDAGTGLDIESILDNLRFDGLDPARLRYLLLTHAHADHAGGAAFWHERFGVKVLASRAAAEYLRQGDEERISLAVAKRAGFYPADYVFRACEVFQTLGEADEFVCGSPRIEVFETPGHCSGMLSFLAEDHGRRCLFTGDTVFHGGKVLVSNLWDCSIQEYVASIGKLARVDCDALLPGHLSIALRGGGAHLRRAHETVERLSMPPNII